MTKVHNFSAGPSVLPRIVKEQLAEELLKDVSLVEESHRGSNYLRMHEDAKQMLVQLLGVPATHEVLMMGTGGTGHFAAVPLNLNRRGLYLVGGGWSSKAAQECERMQVSHAVVRIVDGGKLALPDLSHSDAEYVHVCDNETVDGVELPPTLPQTIKTMLNVPLVMDVSSNLLTRAIPFEFVDVAYAGAQKNAGISGVSFAIVSKTLLETLRPHAATPSTLDYRRIAAANSLMNTPPVLPIQAALFVCRWLHSLGGVSYACERAARRSAIVYDALERLSTETHRFDCPIDRTIRSRINIVFRIKTFENGSWTVSKSLEDAFFSLAAQHNCMYLKGHSSVGGVRASIYNALSDESVSALVQLLETFASQQF